MYDKDFNEDSNSLSIGFAPLEMRVAKTKTSLSKSSDLVNERIKLLDHRLITSMMIITPFQLQNYTFRNQLQNYRFEKKTRTSNIFNDNSGNQEKQFQQLFVTLKDLFSNWRTKLTQKFFIAFANGDLAYFFHKPQDHDIKKNIKKGGSFAILSFKKLSFQKVFQDHKIPYEYLEKTNFECDRLLIKNSAIQLYWKYLTSLSMQKPANFEIIANFYFMNCSEVLPMQNYNGKQQRPQFEHLAQKKYNVLGEQEAELFCMKIQGFWMKDNVQKMYWKLQEMSEGKAFDIEFECHSGSQDIQQQCEGL